MTFFNNYCSFGIFYFKGKIQANSGSFSGKIISSEGKIGNWTIVGSGMCSKENELSYFTTYGNGTDNPNDYQIDGINYQTTTRDGKIICGVVSSGHPELPDTSHGYVDVSAKGIFARSKGRGSGDPYLLSVDTTENKVMIHTDLFMRYDDSIRMYDDNNTNLLGWNRSGNTIHLGDYNHVAMANAFTIHANQVNAYGAYNNASDERYKNSINDISDKLVMIIFEKIKIKTFKYNYSSRDAKEIGVIAQDIILAFDDIGINWKEYNIVNENYDSSVNEMRYSVNYQALNMILFRAMQLIFANQLQ